MDVKEIKEALIETLDIEYNKKNRLFQDTMNEEKYFTAKMNSSVCTNICSKSDTCVNGSKLRGICKIRLNERKCKDYDKILGYSITFDF